MKIKDLKKVQTCFLPTPLHKLDNLTKKIGKAEMYIKRDDLTGLGFGGNKLRKLDYLIHEAKEQGYTTILTYGGVQTNHGRLTAAACAKFGMKCVIMCYGTPPKRATGNVLLDKMLGAEVCFMDTTEVRKLKNREDMIKGYYKLKEDSTNNIIKKYENRGEKVYSLAIGGHTPLGTVGYIEAAKEIIDQLNDMNETIDYVVVGLGSGGTFAGLWLGAKYYNAKFEVIGSCISPKSEKEIEELVAFMNNVSNQFEMGINVEKKDIKYTNDYTGVGYNVPDKLTRETIYELAQSEGIFVDPCYTGKSFRGFLDMIENEKIPKNSKALFIHTGGTPGIYTEEHLLEMQDEIWNGNVTIFEYK